MDLITVWFVVVAGMWTLYLVLEGFDFGVGALLPVLGRGEHAEADREVVLGTIGPVWDGNEVWLIAALGAMFAAFPAWYAGFLSGFYLPMLVVLLALIARGVALEYRHKAPPEAAAAAAWRARWDRCIVAGSLIPAFVWGAVLAATVRGVAFGPEGAFGTRTVLSAALLDPYVLLGGATTVAVFVLHGAVYLGRKTDGPVRSAARALVPGVGAVAVAALAAFLGWTVGAHGTAPTAVPAVLAVVALSAGVLFGTTGREGRGFAASALAVVATTVTLFGSLYPQVLPDIAGGPGLTAADAAAAPYTLGILTVVAAVFLPVVVGYQAWSHWVFRARITRQDAGHP